MPWDSRAPAALPVWELESAELALILEGIDLCGSRRRTRWMPRRAAVCTNFYTLPLEVLLRASELDPSEPHSCLLHRKILPPARPALRLAAMG